MKFTEWCYRKYGIFGFSEGRIFKKVQLPLIDAGMPGTHESYREDPCLDESTYLDLLDDLWFYFLSTNSKPNKENYESFKITYFEALGINYYGITEMPKQGSINLHMDETQQDQFIFHFRNFFPRKSICCLTQKNVIELPAHFIQELLKLYFQEMSSSFTLSAQNLSSYRLRVLNLMNIITNNQLEIRLNLMQRLALDYDNNEYILSPDVVSAYSLSLKVFAELFYESITTEQYQQLHSAAHQLAAYDTQGKLGQSLKTEVKFRCNLETNFYRLLSECQQNGDEHYKNACLLSDLPITSQFVLLHTVEQNTRSLLHGLKSSLPDKERFSFPRFLPDENKQSETNEILLSTGGQSGHIAVTRIVKVGILLDGSLAFSEDQVHHYNYFKIENDLASMVGFNSQNGTLFGTYVTQLVPFEFYNDNISPTYINPFKDPDAYQQAMEKTLTHLIRVERMAILYGNSMKKMDLREKEEHSRLSKLRKQLSGQPYHSPIYYFARGDHIPTQTTLKELKNLRGYAQREGSCPAFSLKSLLASILSPELAALHNNFVQTHDALAYLLLMKEKISELDKRIEQSNQNPGKINFLQGHALRSSFYNQSVKNIPKNVPNTTSNPVYQKL
ncbi:hypothetical protein B1207_10435 [Legionella quinlivanii]|uniref:Uncharacterized protein n=1 Tax=Legionella quinlivanii TaxID=45073 RepID=A0A364LHZ7_9GAMM|nr:hypothetical protein [Legionella quinlivanii]RAP35982.1 hypothetical protein B1207_10435 [Legionella quinlivanii]